MRLTAIVVLVFAAAAAGCSQPQSEPGSAGQQAAGAATGGTSGAGTLTDAGGAANAGGGFGATALAPVSGSTPGGAPGAPGAAGAPAFVEVTIPAGTTLPVVLETAVASDTSTVEQAVVARLSSAVEVNGAAAVPANSTLHGDANLRGPGVKEIVLNTPVNKDYPGKRQVLPLGSYITVPSAGEIHRNSPIGIGRPTIMANFGSKATTGMATTSITQNRPKAANAGWRDGCGTK